MNFLLRRPHTLPLSTNLEEMQSIKTESTQIHQSISRLQLEFTAPSIPHNDQKEQNRNPGHCGTISESQCGGGSLHGT